MVELRYKCEKKTTYSLNFHGRIDCIISVEFSFENLDKIIPQTFSGVSVKQNTLTLDLPPASVIVLALQ